MLGHDLRIPVSHFYFQQDNYRVLESESLRLGGKNSRIEPKARERYYPLAADCRHIFHGLRRPVWLGRRGKRSRIRRSDSAAPGHSIDLEFADGIDDWGAFECASGRR